MKPDSPVLESILSAHTGVVADPEHCHAGCDGPTGEESQADAPPPAARDSAGCAAPVPVEESARKATPPQTVRQFEAALRTLGYTRLQAEHIARQGFSGATANTPAAPEPEPEPDMQSLVAALQRRARAFER